MTGNEHERARELALAARIEDIGEADRCWMATHLDSCAECTSFVDALDTAMGAARLTLVTAPSALVRATQARVRCRAAEIEVHTAAMRPFWIAVAMVFAWGALTTPFVWAAFAWLGAAFQLSRLEWPAMFLFAWMAPALAASLVLLGSGFNRAQSAFARSRGTP